MNLLTRPNRRWRIVAAVGVGLLVMFAALLWLHATITAENHAHRAWPFQLPHFVQKSQQAREDARNRTIVNRLALETLKAEKLETRMKAAHQLCMFVELRLAAAPLLNVAAYSKDPQIQLLAIKRLSLYSEPVGTTVFASFSSSRFRLEC